MVLGWCRCRCRCRGACGGDVGVVPARVCVERRCVLMACVGIGGGWSAAWVGWWMPACKVKLHNRSDWVDRGKWLWARAGPSRSP